MLHRSQLTLGRLRALWRRPGRRRVLSQLLYHLFAWSSSVRSVSLFTTVAAVSDPLVLVFAVAFAILASPAILSTSLLAFALALALDWFW